MGRDSESPPAQREFDNEKQPDTAVHVERALNITSDEQALLRDFTEHQRKVVVRKV